MEKDNPDLVSNNLLSGSQIRKAQNEIKEVHPLLDVRMSTIFGVSSSKDSKSKKGLAEMLKVKKQSGEDIEENTMGQMIKRIAENRRMKEEGISKGSPFMMYGFGINFYFYQIKIILITLFIMALFFLYPLIYFRNCDPPSLRHSSYFISTLGNMGFSSMECTKAKLIYEQIALSCPDGRLGELLYFGIMDPNESDLNRCVQKGNPCELEINLELVNLNFQNECVGKRNCLQEIGPNLFPSSSKCGTNKASFAFAQYSCVQSEKNLAEQKERIELFALLDIGAICVFFLGCFILRKSLPKKWREYDEATVTAADYTVEYSIQKTHYLEFCRKRKAQLGNVEFENTSDLFEYQTYLTDYFEDILKTIPQVSLKSSLVRVAAISFAYENDKVISLLKKRGSYIAYADNENISRMNKEIDNEMRLHWSNYNIPAYAFVMLEDEEAYLRACTLKNKKGRKKRTGVRYLQLEEDRDAELPKLVPAAEPTDIIWENRHVTWRSRIIRKFVLYFIMGFILFISFGLIMYCKMYARDQQQKYPNVQCENLGFNWEDKYKLYEDAAIDDWYHLEIDKKDYRSTGVLLCFCNQLKEKNGTEAIKDTFKSLTTTDEEGMYVEGSICEEAMQGFYFAFVLSKTFGVMVTLINVIFKQIVMRGIGVAKSTTVSHESQSIMLWLFIVQFFNTGLLLLLVSADLSQIWAPLQNVFHGQYPDFTLEWYQELGTLISNVMMIMIFTPFIEFAIAFGMKMVFRFMDKGFHCDSKHSKCKSIQQYVDLYSGPEFQLHYRFSALLNVVFVTLLYGTGMPLLFIFAVLTFLGTNIMDRILLAKFYQQPPNFDISLSKKVNGVLPIAGILHLLMGYWMYTNPYLTSNTLLEFETSASNPKNGHTFGIIENNYLLCLPLLALLAFMFFTLGGIIKRICSAGGKKSTVEEDLPTYHRALTGNDLQMLIGEEQFMREKFEVKMLDDDGFEKLKEAKAWVNSGGRQKKTMTGCPTYDILANRIYRKAFQYTPVEERSFEDQEGTKARVALNLGYFPPSKTHNFTMSAATKKVFTNISKKFGAKL